MLGIFRTLLILPVLLICSCLPVAAATIDDAVELMKSGISESAALGTISNPVIIHETAGQNSTRLKIMNRLQETFSVSVDPGLGVIRISADRPGSSGIQGNLQGWISLRPLHSVVHVVPPGDYMVHVEGASTGHYARVGPGDAEILAVKKHFGNLGMNFIVSQNGSASFASEGPIRSGVRTIHSYDYDSRVITRDPDRVIREVYVTPFPVILDGGYYWPNHYWNSHGPVYESWYFGYDHRSHGSHRSHGRQHRRPRSHNAGHGSSWHVGFGSRR